MLPADRKRGSMIAVTITSRASTPMIPNVRARSTKSTSASRARRRAPSGRLRVVAVTRWLRVHAACSGAACPTPAAMIVSSVASSASELGGEPALAHDQDPVGDGQHLGQLGGDHEHGDAVARQRARAAGGPRPWCRRRCRASARRRSAPTACGPATWRARPSAGCRPRARLTGLDMRPYLTWSRSAQSGGERALDARRTAARRAAGARSDASETLSADRHVHHQALLAAVLGDEADARAPSPRSASRGAAPARRADRCPAS